MSEQTKNNGYSDAREAKKANTGGISDAKDREDYKRGYELGKK